MARRGSGGLWCDNPWPSLQQAEPPVLVLLSPAWTFPLPPLKPHRLDRPWLSVCLQKPRSGEGKGG